MSQDAFVAKTTTFRFHVIFVPETYDSVSAFPWREYKNVMRRQKEQNRARVFDVILEAIFNGLFGDFCSRSDLPFAIKQGIR